MIHTARALAAGLLAAGLLTAPARADDAGLLNRIQKLEAELNALRADLRRTQAQAEAATAVVEQSARGAGGDAATRLGGYGELHYNALGNRKPGGADKDELDFHRFVLFFGHEFNERTRFFSELELEHALAKDTADGSGPGEVELEQAFVERDFGSALTARAGVFLLPVGFLNETHEPDTFYGVERNPVETHVIPTTWWEGGAGLTARLGNGFTVDGALTTGLKTSAAKNYAVRDGRQKAAKALAKDPAYTARLKWAGVPGLELGATIHYQRDIAQGTDAAAGSALLYEAHAGLEKGPFGLRALLARWSLEGTGPKALGADRQEGFYLEPSYKLTENLGVFARYSRWDNHAGDAADSRFTQWDVGASFWLARNVVLKADYQNQRGPSAENVYDGFNLGLGYQF